MLLLIEFREDIRVTGNKRLRTIAYRANTDVPWRAGVASASQQVVAATLTTLTNKLGVFVGRLKDAARREGYLLDENGIRPLPNKDDIWPPEFAQPTDPLSSSVYRTTTGEPLPEHPRTFHEIAADLAALVTDKQVQYGDSAGRTGKILEVLYPGGIPVAQYDRALLVVRVLDKLSRLATHQQDAGGEEPWRDIAGYALLALEKGF